MIGRATQTSWNDPPLPHERERPVLLLVDDLPENLFALEELLRRDDVDIVTARSGREALELVLTHPVALAIIDVQMPEIDGFELAGLLRGVERTRHVPIIFVTAGAMDRSRLFRGYEAGAVDFLFKPIDVQVLRGKVDVFIRLEKQRRELEASENRFRALVQTTSQAVWRLTADGRGLGGSPIWRQLTGQRLEDWMEGRWLEMVHPQDRPLVGAKWQEAREHREACELEFRLQRPGGRYTWTLAKIAPVFDKDGELLEWVGANTDIEERKTLEAREAKMLARIQRSEARLRRLYELGMIGVVFSTQGRAIFDANDAFLELIGRTRGELERGLLDGQALAAPESVEIDREIYRQLAMTGSYGPFNKEFLHRDGHRVPTLVGGARIEGTDDIVSFVLDMREQKESERTREMFIAILGHDLCNPLGSMLVGTQLVLSRTSDESIRRPLERVLMSGKRMERMIDQLLDMTRVRIARSLTLVTEPLDLQELIAQAAEEAPAPAEQILVEVRGDTKGAWDGDRLLQILSNLLRNAYEHGAAGTKIEVMVDGSGAEDVRISVHNHGPAIPGAIQATLFEPFLQLHRPRLTAGLGLGLFISKEFAAAHGGTIEFESSDAHGTTFHLRLPRNVPAD